MGFKNECVFYYCLILRLYQLHYKWSVFQTFLTTQHSFLRGCHVTSVPRPRLWESLRLLGSIEKATVLIGWLCRWQDWKEVWRASSSY